MTKNLLCPPPFKIQADLQVCDYDIRSVLPGTQVDKFNQALPPTRMRLRRLLS